MNRITILENEIRHHQNMYYNNEPEISDAEFDALVDELKNLDPENPLLTNEIGSDHTEGFKKVAHTILMGSQNKANTKEEMNDFFTTKCNPKKVLGQFKMDGSSLELNYVNGKFISAVTRGDGIYGDDVTENVKKMNIPMNIENFTGAVRGEVLLSRENKNKFYPDMKNCRNAAAGILKHLDGSGCEHLDVVCYDAKFLDETKTFGTQEFLIRFLENNKFEVAPYKWFYNINGEMAMEHLNGVFDDFDNLKYDIDGIVWKQYEIDDVDMNTNERPNTQIALKPAKVLKETTLIDIKWQVRNGTLTPVGIFEPVDIQGATIKQASLCNIACMEHMGIEIGHKIIVCRCGMIIPKIIKDVNTGKYAEGYEF